MLENQPTGHFNTPQTFAPLLEAVQDLKFHLDIAHAQVAGQGENLLPKFLERFGEKLVHVHVSDNQGLTDDHVSLDRGVVDWRSALKSLHTLGYNDTLTLEIFKDDRALLLESLQKVRKFWDSL